MKSGGNVYKEILVQVILQQLGGKDIVCIFHVFMLLIHICVSVCTFTSSTYIYFKARRIACHDALYPFPSLSSPTPNILNFRALSSPQSRKL